MKIPYFSAIIVGYIVLILLILPFRLSEKYLTPDEKAYTNHSLIDRSTTSGISFNSTSEKIGLRYLAAAFYFEKVNRLGGRPLIFFINTSIIIGVFYVFWRGTRIESQRNLNFFFAISLLIPSTIFFSAASLRDIFVYAINIFLIYKIGCKNGAYSAGTLLCFLIYLLISPYFGVVSICIFIAAKYCKNTFRATTLLYVVTVSIFTFAFFYLIQTTQTISLFDNNISLPDGVLGENAASQQNSNLKIALANLSMVLTPYLLPRNIVGMLDWLFFAQSVLMIILFPLFISNVTNGLSRFWVDLRFRYSFLNFIMLYPLFFSELNSSSLIRHSLAIIPYYLYLSCYKSPTLSVHKKRQAIA